MPATVNGQPYMPGTPAEEKAKEAVNRIVMDIKREQARMERIADCVVFGVAVAAGFMVGGLLLYANHFANAH